MYERTGTEDCPVWVLEFPHRPGLVVRCTVPSIRGRVLGNRVAPLLVGRHDEDGRHLLALAEVFAEDSLLSWNLLWGGVPRSADAAGIGRVDVPLVAEILAAWIGQWAPTPEPELDPEPDEPEVDWSELETLAVEVTEPPDTEPSGLVVASGQ